MSAAPSIQLHPDALGAIQQSLEVEARQRIVGVRPDKSGECRHGRGAARFELCKSLRILRHRRGLEGIRRERLIGTQRLAAATQDQIAQWPVLKVLRALGERGTDADPGPQKLVGSLQSRCGIDGVAVRGVVEEAAPAEIADQRGTGVNADAGDAEIHAPRLPACAKFLRLGIEVVGAGNRAGLAL
jgi:hypothetical protein